MEVELSETLNSLKPTERLRIIDLVKMAGVDVSDWANFKGKEPATNPKYCYEWSFVSEQTATLVCCIWHDMLEVTEGKIQAVFNVLKTAVTQNAQQKKRAHKFHNDLHRAKDNSWTIRAVILSEKFSRNGTSKVDKRVLDESPWFVDSYDPYTNEWKLTRGKGEHQTKFVDQFSEEGPAFRKEVNGIAFKRDGKQRLEVLERAQGICEFCGQPGFQLPSGALYLETHHIIPLSEGGPDVASNMIALCPNDHREAHYGIKAPHMRVRMQEIIVKSALKATIEP